jgi:hypothetical protein
LPAVQRGDWVRNGIDRFVLAQLEANRLQPVRAADKRTLLRRATFDLTGLPPTPEEVDAFLADDSADAFAKVVDRLLTSPAYGERWARYWLDVARFAEDQAHTFAVEPNVHGWRYRDWVVDAFNADMPYDRFVKLQIAADLVDAPETEKERDLPALGFFGLGAQYYKNTDAAKATADELDDRVDTLSRGFLGLTVSCARCHDHKFDPIPTQDYYSLAGVFHSSKLAKVALAPRDVVARYDQAQGEIRKEEERYKKLVQEEKTRVAEGMTDEVASYLTAAYALQVRRLENPGCSPNEMAKERKLNGDVLSRWVRFLEPNNKIGEGIEALDAWRKLPPPTKGAEIPEEVSAAARALQEQIQRGRLDQAASRIAPRGLLRRSGLVPRPRQRTQDPIARRANESARLGASRRGNDEEGRPAALSGGARPGREQGRRPQGLRPRQSGPARRSGAAPLSPHRRRRQPRPLHQGQRPARTGRGHRVARQSIDAARDGQPHLAAPLRPRHRRHAE